MAVGETKTYAPGSYPGAVEDSSLEELLRDAQVPFFGHLSNGESPKTKQQYDDIELNIDGDIYTAHGLKIIKSGAAILRLLPGLDGQPLTSSYAYENGYYTGSTSRSVRNSAFCNGMKNILSSLRHVAGRDMLELYKPQDKLVIKPYVVKEQFVVNGQEVQPTNQDMVEELLERVRQRKTIYRPKPATPEKEHEQAEENIEIPEGNLRVVALKPGDEAGNKKKIRDLKLGEVAYFVYDDGQQMNPMNPDEWKVFTATGVFDRFGEEWLSDNYISET